MIKLLCLMQMRKGNLMLPCRAKYQNLINDFLESVSTVMIKQDPVMVAKDEFHEHDDFILNDALFDNR